MKLIEIVGYICIGVNIILANVLAHGLIKIYRRRMTVYLSARHMRPLEMTIGISLVFLLCERNIQLLAHGTGIIDLSYWFSWLISNVFTTALLILFLLRVWVLHYDYSAGLALYYHVTNSHLSEDDHEFYEWFLINKTYYGAPIYLAKFSMFFFVFINVIFWAWSMVSSDTFHYGLIIIYACLIIISMTITNKIGYIDDIFFIRNELLSQFRILSLFVLITGVVLVFSPIIEWKWVKIIIIESSSLVIFLMGFISTWWIKSKCDKIDYNVSKLSNSSSSASKLLPIERVLSNPKYIVYFLRHLVRELQHENLFFIIDVISFKRSIIDNRKLKSIPGWEIDVPTTLARLNYRKDRTFVHYAWAISKFYIDGSSAYYLTGLHPEIRETILYLVESLNPSDEYSTKETHRWEQLITTFDSAAEYIFRQIKQSYFRFTQTQEFKNLDIGKAESKVISSLGSELQKRNTFGVDVAP